MALREERHCLRDQPDFLLSQIHARMVV